MRPQITTLPNARIQKNVKALPAKNDMIIPTLTRLAFLSTDKNFASQLVEFGICTLPDYLRKVNRKPLKDDLLFQGLSRGNFDSVESLHSHTSF